MGEFPLLKELYAKYNKQGLIIIGVSLDNDVKTVQAIVKEKAIAWPQVRDGKDGQIAKLFNVKGTPTYYVLDRDGRIAAKDVTGKKLGGVIAEVFQK